MRFARTSTIFALPWTVSVTMPGLRARERDRLVAEIDDRHRGERARDALADGDQHVELARIRVLGDLARQVEQLVRRVAHRREDADDAVARLSRVDEPLRDALQALGARHRGAAELHHDGPGVRRPLVARDLRKRLINGLGHRFILPVDPYVLRRCFETADFTALREWYADDARFDALVPARRVQLVGPDAIVEQLSAWWPEPGALLRWQVDEYASGLTVEFERAVSGGRFWRQRQFLSLDNGKIVRHQVYSARPHSAAEAPPPSPLSERLLAEVGEVASVEPLVHSGQAGGWIERATLTDGRSLVVKRVVPERDLLSRFAGLRESTEAHLWESGALERLPEWIDPAIIAAGRADGETVLVMRDVSDTLVGTSGALTREQSNRFLTGAGRDSPARSRAPATTSCARCARI